MQLIGFISSGPNLSNWPYVKDLLNSQYIKKYIHSMLLHSSYFRPMYFDPSNSGVSLVVHNDSWNYLTLDWCIAKAEATFEKI